MEMVGFFACRIVDGNSKRPPPLHFILRLAYVRFTVAATVSVGDRCWRSNLLDSAIFYKHGTRTKSLDGSHIMRHQNNGSLVAFERLKVVVTLPLECLVTNRQY